MVINFPFFFFLLTKCILRVTGSSLENMAVVEDVRFCHGCASEIHGEGFFLTRGRIATPVSYCCLQENILPPL